VQFRSFPKLMCSVQCTVHCTLCNVHSVQVTLCIVCTVCTGALMYNMYIVHCSVNFVTLHCINFYETLTLYNVHTGLPA
jgi:hypothetical protein